MSLNLAPDGFVGQSDFGMSQRNTAGLLESHEKAVMYVIAPFHKQIGDVALRPLNYTFDENFSSRTAEIMDITKRGSASNNGVINHVMETVNLSDYMIPSYQPDMILKGSNLDGKYRFILFITESGVGLNTMISTTGSSQVRRIYTGFFMDEPYNPTTYSSTKHTPNPNAFIVITHKTVIGSRLEHGMFGAQQKINTQASENIINPMILKTHTIQPGGSLQDNRLFLMTPENCVNSMDVSEDSMVFTSPSQNSDITNGKASETVVDQLEQPTHNVAQVLRGAILYQDDITHRSVTPMYNQDFNFDNDFLQGDYQRNRLASRLAIPAYSSPSIFDLDVDSQLSLIDLNNLVNNSLKVLPIEFERSEYYETADQTEMSMTNVYSTLITDVISPLLHAVGLNEISFKYERAILNGIDQDDFCTYSASGLYPMSNDEIVSRTIAVKVELIRGIFRTIFESNGDFSVTVNANSTGITTVRLSLIGQGYRNPVNFEMPSCLGGLISPLLGSSVSSTQNSSQIEGLYGHLTGTPTSFDSDDKAFMDHAIDRYEDSPTKQLSYGFSG